MIEITPEAQALIDRLAALDATNERHDKAAIERATEDSTTQTLDCSNDTSIPA